MLIVILAMSNEFVWCQDLIEREFEQKSRHNRNKDECLAKKGIKLKNTEINEFKLRLKFVTQHFFKCNTFNSYKLNNFH